MATKSKKPNTLAPMLASVTRAALNASTSLMEAANAVKVAFERHRHIDADGKPTERAKAVRAAHIRGHLAGQLRAKVPQLGNAPDDALCLEADRIMLLATYVDPKGKGPVPKLPKGKAGRQTRAEYVMLGTARNSWSTVLKLAGFAALDNRGKTPRKPRTTDTGSDKPNAKTVAVPLAQAKALPPVKPDRETAIEYARVALAQIMLTLEKANQSAAKTNGKAIPAKIMGDVQDWQATSKTWAC